MPLWRYYFNHWHRDWQVTRRGGQRSAIAKTFQVDGLGITGRRAPKDLSLAESAQPTRSSSLRAAPRARQACCAGRRRCDDSASLAARVAPGLRRRRVHRRVHRRALRALRRRLGARAAGGRNAPPARGPAGGPEPRVCGRRAPARRCAVDRQRDVRAADPSAKSASVGPSAKGASAATAAIPRKRRSATAAAASATHRRASGADAGAVERRLVGRPRLVRGDASDEARRRGDVVGRARQAGAARVAGPRVRPVLLRA